MNRIAFARFAQFAILMSALFINLSLAQAQTTAFTYQGRLTDNTLPANGSYDFQFKLFDALTGGTQIGSTSTQTNVTVSGGVFSVTLDFGAGAFPGANRWLEISTRLAGVGGFTMLSPRRPFTSTPYALRSLIATTASSADSLSLTCANCVSGNQITVPLNLSGSNGSPIISATNNGAGGTGISGISVSKNGVVGQTASAVDAGVYGFNTSATGNAVWGFSAGGTGTYGQSVTGDGVRGYSTGSAKSGVYGQNDNAGGVGVYGAHTATAGTAAGVVGTSDSVAPNAAGVHGIITSTSPEISSAGVRGDNNGTGAFGLGVRGSHAGSGWGVGGSSVNGRGVNGYASGTTSFNYGVYGLSDSSNGIGVFGNTSNLGGITYGVYATSSSVAGTGVYGNSNYGMRGHGSNIGIYAHNTSGTPGRDAYLATAVWAGDFYGNVRINGSVSKAGGSFKIDHPLDPANKYLYHSFVESPDMMNIYNGNVTTDANAEAEITMPEWFSALNSDFRYQLTVIGTFAQAIVAEEIKDNRFKIKTSQPNVKVSWQVTGIRQDAWAKKNRIPIEEAKPEQEKGFYLHPEVFGQSDEKNVQWARHPEKMTHVKEEQERMRQQPNEPSGKLPQPKQQ